MAINMTQEQLIEIIYLAGEQGVAISHGNIEDAILSIDRMKELLHSMGFNPKEIFDKLAEIHRAKSRNLIVGEKGTN